MSDQEAQAHSEELSHADLIKLILSMRTVTRALGLIVAMLLALNIAMQVQLQHTNKQLDSLEETANEAKEAANKASTDLSAAIESSNQGSENAQAAVQLIFSIFDVVCEQSPQAEPCQNRQAPPGQEGE